MTKKTLLILFIVASFLSACAQTPKPGATPLPTSTQTVPTATSPAPLPYPGPATAAPTQGEAYPAPSSAPTQAATEMTPAQVAAVQALSQKYNIPIEQIKITSTEAVTWPGGCLGVVIPGVLCTDVVTPGFRIIMDAVGQQYEFHTNQDGTNVIDAAQLLATLGFVVKTADGTINVVNPNIPLGPTYNPAFNGFLPLGGAILGTGYVLDWGSQSKAISINSAGQKDLPFIQNSNYALAIWRGGPGTSPMLAWGTQANPGDGTSSLIIAAPDGTNQETLLTSKYTTDNPIQLVAELWSADGQSLYFSKEPVGIGGYIVFNGASNLYKIDIKTKQVTEIIPQQPMNSAQICYDAISGDYRFVADHCTLGAIFVRNLETGTSATIQAPQDISGYRLAGSARFNPTGDLVAYALAKGDPNNEQGWVAIGPSTGGTSKAILTGEAGSYYTVVGWLDDQTILIQKNPVMCPSGTCNSELFSVEEDGSNLTKVADGSYLTIIDNR